MTIGEEFGGMRGIRGGEGVGRGGGWGGEGVVQIKLVPLSRPSPISRC